MNRILDAREFARRRRQLMRMAGRDAIIIVPSAEERVRNNDAHYPFRQDSDFHYLTGFAEPDAVLALVPGRSQGEVILFCRERDRAREQWDGHRAGQEGAVADFGMDDAFPIDDIDDILPGLIEGRSRVYYHFGRETRFDLILMGWVNRVRPNIKQGAKPPHEFVALSHLLHDLRLYKSRSELRLMRKSAQIAAEAHVRAMRTTRPGMNENEVEAELLHTFRKHNAVPSYEPIVGAGTNACVLHYRANNATMQDGDLLLIDAGAEYACYASDITRTFPVNGRFTPEQRELYDIVLAAQLAAIEEVRPGKSFEAYHLAAVRVLTQGLIRLGLLKGSLRSNLESHTYRKFYMHKTGHWLGLDVHDAGEYKVGDEWTKLAPGMTLTVEPGLYIRPGADIPPALAGIGIRIEDDVRVTETGCDIFTTAPKTVADIEEVMRHD